MKKMKCISYPKANKGVCFDQPKLIPICKLSLKLHQQKVGWDLGSGAIVPQGSHSDFGFQEAACLVMAVVALDFGHDPEFRPDPLLEWLLCLCLGCAVYLKTAEPHHQG